MIGQPCNNTADCTNTTHPPGPPYKYTCRFHNDMQSGVSLFASSRGAHGPWVPHGRVLNGTGSENGGMFNNSRTNPAPLAEKDGSVKLVFRGGSKGYKAEFLGRYSLLWRAVLAEAAAQVVRFILYPTLQRPLLSYMF